MNVMPRAQQGELDRLIEAAREAEAEVALAVDDANEKLARLVDGINEALADYNKTRAALAAFRDGFVSDLQAEFDGRSERWQEGDVGQQHRAWIDAWQNLELDEIEEFEPEEIEFEAAGAVEEVAEAPRSRDEA